MLYESNKGGLGDSLTTKNFADYNIRDFILSYINNF